jgi:ferredoxin-thioredoxin reductase catalytic subunit
MNPGAAEKAIVEKVCGELEQDARASGYFLNSDKDFVRDLAEGLVTNERRYGYRACPCRLASGTEGEDRDIECPCDYRDADLAEFGQCYCALYVSEERLRDPAGITSIPERRGEAAAPAKVAGGKNLQGHLSHPVWRCKVCGYLCARDEPPALCPVCKAKKDRFERFL